MSGIEAVRWVFDSALRARYDHRQISRVRLSRRQHAIDGRSS